MKRIVLGIVFAVAVWAVAGCAGGSSGSSNAPDPEVRFFNGISDVGFVDFLFNEEVEQTGIAYLGSSPDFADTEPVERDVTVRETGMTEAIWTEAFQYERDKDYLMCSLGLKNFGTEFLKRARLAQFEIDRRLPNANKARVYVIHGFNRAAGSETTDIDFQNPGNNPQVRFAGLQYMNAGNLDIDATTHTFEARRAGTESVYVSTSFTFESGKIYAIFILGLEGEVGVQAPRIEIIELTTE